MSNKKISKYVRQQSETSTISLLLTLLPYLIPFFLFLFFLFDLLDWIVNQESVYVPTGSAVSIQGKQSRIITILSFMRSQFTYFLGASASLTFFLKLEKLKKCRVSLKKIYRDLCDDGSSAGKNLYFFPRRVVFPWTALGVSVLLNLFRFSYYIYSNPRGVLFWEPKQYSVITLPSGVFAIAIELSMLVAELVPQALYAIFFHLCCLQIESSFLYNKELKRTIKELEKERQSVAGDSLVTGENFEDRLDRLSRTGLTISGMLDELDRSLCGFIFVVLTGNCLLLASILSRSFVAYYFQTVISYVVYGANLLPSLISLVLIVNVCSALHETNLQTVRRWQDLVIIRQSNRDENHRKDEGEKLLTILHRMSSGHHSLTVAGTAHVTRSFGVSLLCGFVGFMCFLIERSEHYETEASVRLSHRLNCTFADD